MRITQVEELIETVSAAAEDLEATGKRTAPPWVELLSIDGIGAIRPGGAGQADEAKRETAEP